MTFSSELWDRGAASVYEEIVRHPFITGLTDGSLDHDAFRYFIVQDSHYLRAYSTSPIWSMCTNGSSAAMSTPANARRTGNPSPS